MSFFMRFNSFSSASNTFKLHEYCSVRISEFMMQGLCTKCELFICKTVSVHMFWPIFLVLFILLLFEDVNGFIVTFNKGK